MDGVDVNASALLVVASGQEEMPYGQLEMLAELAGTTHQDHPVSISFVELRGRLQLERQRLAISQPHKLPVRVSVSRAGPDLEAREVPVHSLGKEFFHAVSNGWRGETRRHEAPR